MYERDRSRDIAKYYRCPPSWKMANKKKCPQIQDVYPSFFEPPIGPLLNSIAHTNHIENFYGAPLQGPDYLDSLRNM